MNLKIGEILFYSLMGCSKRFNFRSKTKGPNGKIEAARPMRKIVIDHFCFSQTANKTIKNRMKSTPCPIPTYFTKTGLSNIYFIGMAMNKSRRKERPSKRPTTRKVWIFMVMLKSMRMNPECTQYCRIGE